MNTKDIEEIVGAFLTEFENKFVEVIAEEAGGSLWKRKSNPDEVPQMIRDIATNLTQRHKAELEKAVEAERERIASDLVSYQHESGNTHIDIEWFAEVLLTPTKTDKTTEV